MNLGYEFRNPALLAEALTTPSFRMSEPTAHDNQRLEFLGDAVLGFLAADRLYAEFPHEAEGPLTVKRTHLVSSAALCAAAERLGLAAHLRRNRGAAELPRTSKTLADAIEAIIGAAWLDGGLAAAKAVFDALELEVNAEAGVWSGNPKGDLQIKTQAMTPPRHGQVARAGFHRARVRGGRGRGDGQRVEPQGSGIARRRRAFEGALDF